ncbi:MAG: NDP-sugar synthase [Acidobacteriota bacterium]
MKGMILAAGFGTRFRPATYEVPKPMVPLCNQPLIDYAAEAMLGSGMSDLIVNLHHLPDMIRGHMERRYGKRCTLHFSLEETILGTGGGIRRVRSLLESDADFFLANADTIQFPPFEKLADVRRSHDALAALLLRQPPRTDRFTKVYFENERVTGFGEGQGQTLMFAGAHNVSRRIFERLPDAEFSGVTEDVYLPAVRQQSDTLAAVLYDGPWFDIGTPSRYLAASSSIAALMISGKLRPPPGSETDSARRSLLSDESRIEGEFEESVFGPGSATPGRSQVSQSVFWSGATIGEDCVVDRSILCDGVQLPAGSHVANAMVCRRLDISYAEGIAVDDDFAYVPIDSSREAMIK